MQLHPLTSRFTVEGTERPLHPLLRDEVFHIGSEAIRNACQHSGGTELDVLLSYTQSFVLTVADNGQGIDAGVAARGAPGHFGIPGMRERALRIHASLSLLSERGAGTIVRLQLMGRPIYTRNQHKARSRSF